METIELRPNLHLLLPAFGQVYLWRDADSLTLVETGVPGSGADIATAIRSLGHDPGDLRRVVLTHFHVDHAGSAAEIGAWDGVEVVAHRLDAPAIRGDVPGSLPNLTDKEGPLFEQITGEFPPTSVAPPPARVDREVEDGDVIDFGGGARVIATPGHTDGSIALHLPDAGVLFTGDIAANPEGQVILGVFNTDRDLAKESFRRLARLDPEVLCFGHGAPITDEATAALRDAVTDGVRDPLG